MTQALIDHIGMAVLDLAASRATVERLGFYLTPLSLHLDGVGDAGGLVPSGSGNHCAIYRTGYLELIGSTAPNGLGRIEKMLAKGEGVQILALATTSVESSRRDVKSAGIALGPNVQLRRWVDQKSVGKSGLANSATPTRIQGTFRKGVFLSSRISRPS